MEVELLDRIPSIETTTRAPNVQPEVLFEDGRTLEQGYHARKTQRQRGDTRSHNHNYNPAKIRSGMTHLATKADKALT